MMTSNPQARMLVAGLDVARGGGDDCVIRFRRGVDARTIPAIRIPGEQARDSMRLVAAATQVLDQTYEGRRVAMLFVDGTGVGGPIADRLCQLGYRIAGGTVCPTHGGRSPHVKAAAMARLKAFQDLALTRLFGLALQEQYPSTAYSAVRDVLDRTMGRPVETQHVTVATDADALDRILSQRASRVPGAVVPAPVPDDE